MSKIVPIGIGFDSPQALLVSLAEKGDEIEWLALSYQTKDGRFSNFTNNMTLADLALMAISWLGIVHKFEE